MFATSKSPDSRRTRNQAVEEIDRAMARFDLVLNILGELNQKSLPFPGDSDIRHGCERALTAMLVELARIEPASPGPKVDGETDRLEALYGPRTNALVDSDQLLRMEQFIKRILHMPQSTH